MTSAGWQDERTDHQLVDAVRRGDEHAFDVLYHRHRDWVLRLAWRFTRNDSDALDVLQETFAYLARRLPTLRLEARLTTFLYPVVKNAAVTMARKSRRYRSLETAEPSHRGVTQGPPGASRPGDSLPISQETRRADLSVALRSLPDEARETLLMRFVDGMSLAEIAGALGVPLGTVKSRLHNALRSLRDDPRARGYFEP